MTAAVLLMIVACIAAAAAMLEAARAIPTRPSRARRPRTGGTSPPAEAGPGVRWAAARMGDPAAERLLDAAGRGRGVATSAELAARERTAAVIAGLWSAVLLAPAIGTLGAGLLVLPAGIAGHRVPRLLLARSARARAEQLRDEAPDALALLASGAGCGLPLAPLLALAGDWLPGELAAGFARASAELRRGAAPAQVLAALERDHPIDEVVSLCAILQRGRAHGVAIAPAVRALAAGSRSARTRRASDRAAKAAPRIQLVAALLLVPAALCVLGAAMLGGGLG